MPDLPEIPHWSFIPDEVVNAQKFSDQKINVTLLGPVAAAVRDEARETSRTDEEVVCSILEAYLTPGTWSPGPRTHYLPIEVTVKGALAQALRRNAATQGISPEDSALAILSDAFGFGVPPKAVAPKSRPTKGLKITICVPGRLAQHIRRQFPISTVNDKFIVSLLQQRLLPQDHDTPPLPGMSEPFR